MASPASPIGYVKQQVATMKVNSQGTWNMLELAERTGARFLMASTSECYGDPMVNPQKEEYWGNVNPIGLRSMYDEAKRYAEAFTTAFAAERHVDVRIARIFNTYGPRLRPGDGRVVSNFIVQALAGEPLTIYGEGTQTRSFCYVDDLVEGLVRLMNTDHAVTGPINLGNPGEFTIRQLAEIVIEMTGSRSEIVQMPLPQDDPLQRRPDITKARELLDWQPTIPLRQGLERTIEYFKTLAG